VKFAKFLSISGSMGDRFVAFPQYFANLVFHHCVSACAIQSIFHGFTAVIAMFMEK
jgi:hypothetical protein